MIPLFKPYVPDLPALHQVLHSGALSYGAYTKQFENCLKSFFETPFLIVTSSFHFAISVALRTMNIGFGDNLIASPMTCLASMQPLLSAGVNIIWADIDPTTGTLDPISVRNSITSNTKGIIHNHFCGYPGHISDINDIGKKYGIPVIDDGLECFGTEYYGKKIGNCGSDVTVFSLNPIRFCNCIEGGIVIFKDEEHFSKSLLIRDCGIDRSRFRDEMGEIDPNCDISLVGYNAMMSNVNGYIGLKQMENIVSILDKHRQQAQKWDLYLSNQASLTKIHREHCNPNYWVYGVLSNDKTGTIKKFRERGYYASGVHIRNDIYSVFETKHKLLPGVEEFNKRFVALPCGWWMNEQ